jgi:anti-anti-sigma factor
MLDAQPYLDVATENGVLILTVMRRQIEGEGLALSLKEELLSSVSRSGLAKVVLDLQRTQYVSSIAFWPLLALRHYLADRGGRLLLCGLTGAVHDVFTSTRMVSGSGSTTAPFEVVSDRAAAVASLADEAVRIGVSEG